MRFAVQKPFIAGILIGSAGLASASDVVFNNPENMGHWGLRASLDVSNPGDWKTSILKFDMFGDRLGASVGAYYHLPIIANFYFEPGASLFYDTYKFDVVVNEESNEISSHIDKFGIRLPLDVGYHFDIWENASLFVKTGPQLMYGFSEKMHIKTDEPFDGNMYGEDGLLKRFDMLWDVAAGADFGRWNFALEYNFGLLNLVKDTGGILSYHENYFRIAVGFAF